MKWFAVIALAIALAAALASIVPFTRGEPIDELAPVFVDIRVAAAAAGA